VIRKESVTHDIAAARSAPMKPSVGLNNPSKTRIPMAMITVPRKSAKRYVRFS
jgi:hypothetical protein